MPGLGSVDAVRLIHTSHQYPSGDRSIQQRALRLRVEARSQVAGSQTMPNFVGAEPTECRPNSKTGEGQRSSAAPLARKFAPRRSGGRRRCCRSCSTWSRLLTHAPLTTVRRRQLVHRIFARHQCNCGSGRSFPTVSAACQPGRQPCKLCRAQRQARSPGSAYGGRCCTVGVDLPQHALVRIGRSLPVPLQVQRIPFPPLPVQCIPSPPPAAGGRWRSWAGWRGRCCWSCSTWSHGAPPSCWLSCTVWMAWSTHGTTTPVRAGRASMGVGGDGWQRAGAAPGRT